MLAQHTEMELAKVNEVILDEAASEAGPSDHATASRRSAALRARASLTAMVPTRRNTNPNPSTHTHTHDREPPTPTSRNNRRTRSSLGAPADSMVERRRRRVGGVCPVCEEDVAEDLEEHVDRCLQDAVLPHREQSAARTESVREERSASPEREELVRATDFTDFRGTGFDIRDRNMPDVEDDLDIDGDEDTVLYGESQFFESDIIARDEDSSEVRSQREISPTSETNGHAARTLRDLVAVRKAEMTIREVDIEGEEEDERVSVGSSTGPVRSLPSTNTPALNGGGQDKDAHIASLMAKIGQLESTIQQHASQLNTPIRATFHARIKSASATEDASPTVCRICLDAFVEPVVSTGCWHLFCRVPVGGIGQFSFELERV
ncbi:E3 ubiquitin-protein ligase [Ceratobasidium sp. AG-Ba]|nr:E3 ubiquitin-protein ligase [Ceratobasidium sp. AG-Ba]QRW01936.1 E3 ubiquitin-protein ligase [Ceratobasidium sp. AG-Ba]